jgi:hypothetical protein
MVCFELDIICACYYSLGIDVVWVYFGQDGTSINMYLVSHLAACLPLLILL